MDLAVVQLDGAEGARGEAARLELAAVGWLLAVRVQVLPQVDEILAATRKRLKEAGWVPCRAESGLWALFWHRAGRTAKPRPSPVVAVVTLERPLLAVPKTDVIAQGGGQRAGHVAQRALVMVHCGERRGGNVSAGQGESGRFGARLGEGALFSPWFLMWSRSSLSVANLLEQ